MDSRPLIRGVSDSPGEAEGVTSVASSVLEVAAIALSRPSCWWNGAEIPVLLQDWIFRTLAVLYGIVAAVALIQLIRIECRVPEYGWTTQKVFHFLNFLVNGVRSVVFVLRRDVQHIRPEVFQHVLLDLPSLAFFTTYALLVLFWAEIYYQARAVSTDRLRPTFYTINAALYTIQSFLAGILVEAHSTCDYLIKAVSCRCLIICSPRISSLWRKAFPDVATLPCVESRGRRKKLQEVGYVATICFLCFLVRCIMMCLNAYDKYTDLDVLDHPILNVTYYLLVEIVPSSLVLFILMKLPPKRATQYHPIY